MSLKSMWQKHIIVGIITCIFSLSVAPVFAQSWTVDLFEKNAKPEKYSEKKLPSEKTGEKRFTALRRFVQNNTTRYNYYFNAANKLNSVIERSIIAQKDDYLQLISFYPFSLDNTSQQQTELDSVIYKATAGILLHDLRSDWVDNMYLLIGKSYFYKKQFDSAALTFQFINYNLFPRKKSEDYDSRKVVGTNSFEDKKAVTIADEEKRNFLQKILTLPPSRNEALIWLIKTYTEQGEYSDAASLFNILKQDPNMPNRLKANLAEVTSHWFYVQKQYDSSAFYLEQGLKAAMNKQDQSRWEFLLAQMYEMTGAFDKADVYYAKAGKHTVDPILEIYAQLNRAKMLRNDGNANELENAIATLKKMAKRDKYDGYQDVIYYSLAQLALQRPDTIGAMAFYKNSIDYPATNELYHNRAYFDMANLSYKQQNYINALNYYDSLKYDHPEFALIENDIKERRDILRKLVGAINVVTREDSLQMVASLAPDKRDAFIKDLIKKRNRELRNQGVDVVEGVAPIEFNSDKNKNIDLFTNSSISSGEWYFYNRNSRARGYSDFVRKWGKRKNTDNWRRQAAASKGTGLPGMSNPDEIPNDVAIENSNTETDIYNYDAMLANLPLSPEMLDSSNLRIQSNLLKEGKIFQFELEDHPAAINIFNELLSRFPNSNLRPDTYLGLYYSYMKLGNSTVANRYKDMLNQQFAGSEATKTINKKPEPKAEAANPAATAVYAQIYNLYIEGKFDEAVAKKLKADSTYGTNYWTPQLLYIEAVHLIKGKQDSLAIAKLNTLKNVYPTSELAVKATTLIDVVGRRKQIEDYLTKLNVKREEEELVMMPDDKPMNVMNTNQPIAPAKPTAPSTINNVKPVEGIKVPETFIKAGFVFNPNQPHFVAMVLGKVDEVYVNEARVAYTRYNRSSMATQNISIVKDKIDNDVQLLLFSNFDNAAEAFAYFDKAKKAAPQQVSWLPANKYSFIIISESNLNILKQNKDLKGYKELLNQNFDNKF